ncbi:RING finger protein 17-like isoform X2 [Ornithorhynchus anatinus]|uniref:RING finger protein 17-like isoform X2 n=1 Tax=Ornithorhynchus anatinus TaxID=9258 RepID=UPI0010A85080|nr:RING finger protein 17-like isoform X2 [Ornithorhynchus anatinus]
MEAAGEPDGSGSDSGSRAGSPRPSSPAWENRQRHPSSALCGACGSSFSVASGPRAEVHFGDPHEEACISRPKESKTVLCPDCEILQILKSGFETELSQPEPVKLSDPFTFQSLLPCIQPEKNMDIGYHPPILPKESTEVNVVVCHVNNPDDFYLQLVEKLDFLLFLKIIKDAYKNECDGENLEILCPVQGQACIAKFEDGILYRAEVIGLPGHQEVEVMNVDTGRSARIALKDIRQVKEEFLNFPRKAIKCKLANIEPSTGTGHWSVEAKEKFVEMIYGQFLICSVKRILEDNVLLVELFLSPHVPGVMTNSVNSELVKGGLACYDLGQV